MNFNIKHYSTAGLLAVLILINFSCKTDTASIEKDTTLDIAVSGEPKMLNPFIRSASLEREVYQHIFTPMSDFHPETYDLQPILIKELPVNETITEGPLAGGVKYSFEFREDAKWDDGSPITGKDYEFSIKAIKHQGTQAGNYRNYIGAITDVKVDKDNDRKVEVLFKDYYMLSRELVATMEIYPKYIYDSLNILDGVTIAQLTGEAGRKLVSENKQLADFASDFNSIKYARDVVSGPGPYRLKEWTANQRIVLEKKENYWAKNPHFPSLEAGPDQIVFHILPDPASTMTQLKEGNIDVVNNISADNFFDLKENESFKGKFQFFNPELMRYYFIGLNNSKPALSSAKVRTALAKFVDVDQLIKVMENGLGTQTIGIFNAKKAYYNKSLKPIKLDVDGAKSLLASDGWKDSNGDGTLDKMIKGQKVELDLVFHITGSPLSKNLALMMQEKAKEAGVKINIVSKPFAQISKEHIETRDYDMTAMALTQSLTLDDPYSKWHSDNDSPDDANTLSYRSEEADKLIEQIRTTKNAEERKNYYMQLQQVMYEDQPAIFLYNPQEKIVASSNWNAKSTLKRPGYLANTFTPK